MSTPIEPVEFVHGLNVVDIGDLRVARGRSRRAPSICRHLQLVFDTAERRIYCLDCKTDVEAFDAFMQMVERHHYLDEKAERMRSDAAHSVISRAGKQMDQAWRSRTMAPACPHCKAAILPEDVVDGFPTVARDLEIRRRAIRTEI
ncbi:MULTISPECIES: hypothetical protein [Achromobacter]|uniref:hypothetical protein n=1 Tax=Achromobacter TaxID=222 RepID=UPI0023F64BD7|nr:hypothetical protein [Achromobacter anxifer]MDF8363370.1 hypothetical protein [Achromobacter anxifer]